MRHSVYFYLFIVGLIIGNFHIHFMEGHFCFKALHTLLTHFLCFFSSKLFCNNFRLNLTLNRDKELDESADEYADEVEDIKPLHSYPSHKSKKAPPMRSRSVLGCDQMGIETLVSMINSGESDSEKEDGQSAQQQQPPPPMIKNEPPQRIRANMLRKTGNA